MKTEHIIKRDDGSRIMISVVSHFDFIINNLKYRWDVKQARPGKRKFVFVVDMNSYSYRRLSYEDRDIFQREEHLKHVTHEEVIQAMLEHWNKMKPTIDNV